MKFRFSNNTNKILIQCPKCKSVNIKEDQYAIWCNDCKYKVDNKHKDLQILFSGGGTISPLSE